MCAARTWSVPCSLSPLEGSCPSQAGVIGRPMGLFATVGCRVYHAAVGDAWHSMVKCKTGICRPHQTLPACDGNVAWPWSNHHIHTATRVRDLHSVCLSTGPVRTSLDSRCTMCDPAVAVLGWPDWSACLGLYGADVAVLWFYCIRTVASHIRGGFKGVYLLGCAAVCILGTVGGMVAGLMPRAQAIWVRTCTSCV